MEIFLANVLRPFIALALILLIARPIAYFLAKALPDSKIKRILYRRW